MAQFNFKDHTGSPRGQCPDDHVSRGTREITEMVTYGGDLLAKGPIADKQQRCDIWYGAAIRMLRLRERSGIAQTARGLIHPERGVRRLSEGNRCDYRVCRHLRWRRCWRLWRSLPMRSGAGLVAMRDSGVVDLDATFAALALPRRRIGRSMEAYLYSGGACAGRSAGPGRSRLCPSQPCRSARCHRLGDSLPRWVARRSAIVWRHRGNRRHGGRRSLPDRGIRDPGPADVRIRRWSVSMASSTMGVLLVSWADHKA